LTKAIISVVHTQSHNNNGFFKLVESLLQIHPCFFHTVQNYVPFRYQQPLFR